MKSKNKVFVLAALSVLAIISTVFVGIYVGKANAAVVWDEVTIESQVCGDTFTVPERAVEIDGEKYVSTVTVIYPNGKAVSSREVILNQSGLYTVKYTAKDKNGKAYTREETFLVNIAAYTYSDSETSAEYVEGYRYKNYETTSSGLSVRLQDQDSLNFQGIISVPTDKSQLITLAEFFVTPDTVGVADFKTVNLLFTDVTDSEVTLQVQLNVNKNDANSSDGWWATYTYCMAGGNGQTIKGLEGTSILHENDGYGGVVVSNSFYGIGKNLAPIDPSKNAYKVQYNPVTQEVYLNDKFIIDLDDSEYFGGKTDVKWNGFTSGGVRLSVSADNYKQQSANFFITYIKDIDLSSTVTVDNAAPEITVYTDYDMNNMPEAHVGTGMYYPVPEATAFDLFSGECAVSVAVYLNYNTSSPTKVRVSGGKFEVKQSGMYAIVYTAKDANGNTATETAWVHAGGEIADITFGDISVTCTGVVGDKIIVERPSVSGGTGDLEIRYEAESPDGDIQSAWGDIEAFDFYPEVVGVWKVRVTAIDYMGVFKTEELTFDLAVPSEPRFREEPHLPRVFVDGFSYELPEITVYDYRSGRLETSIAKVEVTDKNGKRNYNSGEVFVPSVNSNGEKINVRYFYPYDNKEVVLGEYDIPAIFGVDRNNSERLLMGNYFYSENPNFTTETTYVDSSTGRTKAYEDGMLFTVNEAGESSWTFANAVSSEGFYLDFRTVAGKSNFSAFKIRLTDYEDADVSYDIEIKKVGGVYMLECGSVYESTKISVASGRVIQIEIVSGRVVVNNLAFDANLDFVSGRVHFEFILEGASVGTQYHVYSVCGPITTSSYDAGEPIIVVNGDKGGVCSIGETYYVCPAFALDVIAPSVKCSLTVIDPDGNVAKDEDGILLKEVDPNQGYYLVCNKYGEYRVEYLAEEDGLIYTNKSTVFFTVKVVDEKSPTASIKAPDAVLKKGATISVPSVVPSDDVSSSDDVIVEIGLRDPNGRFVLVSEDSIQLNIIGNYELRFLIMDEAGNTTLYTYSIRVTD